MKKTRYIPEGHTQQINREDLNAVVYVYGDDLAIGYSGKRTNWDFYYRFPSRERMEKHIADFFTGIERTLKNRADRKESRKRDADEFLAKLEVGTVLYTSWGYEQTNVDFYEVVAKKGKTVHVQKILSRTVKETGWASDLVTAGTGEDRFTGEIIKVSVRGPYIKLTDCVNAYLWDGKEKHRSWYA